MSFGVIVIGVTFRATGSSNPPEPLKQLLPINLGMRKLIIVAETTMAKIVLL